VHSEFFMVIPLAHIIIKFGCQETKKKGNMCDISTVVRVQIPRLSELGLGVVSEIAFCTK
jgi:hypothetical protein